MPEIDITHTAAFLRDPSTQEVKISWVSLSSTYNKTIFQDPQDPDKALNFLYYSGKFHTTLIDAPGTLKLPLFKLQQALLQYLPQ